jgi:hypothetical protein
MCMIRTKTALSFGMKPGYVWTDQNEHFIHALGFYLPIRLFYTYAIGFTTMYDIRAFRPSIKEHSCKSKRCTQKKHIYRL